MLRIPFLFAFLFLLLNARPAPAASSLGRFWVGFQNFWGGTFSSLGGVVGIALLVGVAAIFIITRGKWLK